MDAKDVYEIVKALSNSEQRKLLDLIIDEIENDL